MSRALSLGALFAERARLSRAMHVHFVDACSSTTDLVKGWEPPSEQHGLLVVAGHQTQGRGRLGRSWLTHDGMLAFSLGVANHVTPSQATAFTFLTGAALLEACGEDLPIRSKWPNDILCEHAPGAFKKVAGILIEATSHQAELTGMVIGVGINVLPPAQGFPEHLPQAGALNLKDEKALRTFFDRLVAAISKWVLAPQPQLRLSAALEILVGRSAMKGRLVRISSGKEEEAGLFHGLDEDGALILRLKNDEIKRFNVGDVFFDGYETN